MLLQERWKDQWQGLAAEQRDGAFCQFSEMKYGWRAAFILLCRTYYFKNKLTTLRQIISRWAPPNENNTTRYVDTVAAWMKINPDYHLDHPASNTGLWLQLAYCMACYEAGINPRQNSQIELLPLVEGWMMYENSTITVSPITSGR